MPLEPDVRAAKRISSEEILDFSIHLAVRLERERSERVFHSTGAGAVLLGFSGHGRLDRPVVRSGAAAEPAWGAGVDDGDVGLDGWADAGVEHDVWFLPLLAVLERQPRVLLGSHSVLACKRYQSALNHEAFPSSERSARV